MASAQGGEYLSVIEDADTSHLVDEYVLLKQRQHDALIDEVDECLDENMPEGVDTIDVDATPTITASPNFMVEGPTMMDQTQPLISRHTALDSADTEQHPFECSRTWFCRRQLLLKVFYLFLGIVAFCGLIVLADEIGVSTVNTIRRYRHRSNSHTNPHDHRAQHSRPYPGPRYLRVPGEQQCHHEMAYYQQADSDRYAFSCAVQWSYEESSSLQISCEEGYALNCLFSASYGYTTPSDECLDWETEDMEEYPILPQSVWEEECAGQRECTLEMGRVGGSDYTCSDESGVENAYYDAVNGVQMDQYDASLLKGFKRDCQFVAMKVQALCQKEESE